MNSLRKPFLHVAVLALAVLGVMLSGTIRSLADATVVIGTPNQSTVYCIQDDRFPHSFLTFVAGPKDLDSGVRNPNWGAWSFTLCGNTDTIHPNPRTGIAKFNTYLPGFDFFPIGGIAAWNPYDLYLADNNIAGFSLFRSLTTTATLYPPQFGNQVGVFWPNVQVTAGVDSRIIANNNSGDGNSSGVNGAQGVRPGEAFVRLFQGGAVYHIYDSNIDDGGLNGGTAITPTPNRDYSTYGYAWPTTCKCP